jgi:hypothetical protein
VCVWGSEDEEEQMMVVVFCGSPSVYVCMYVYVSASHKRKKVNKKTQ